MESPAAITLSSSESTRSSDDSSVFCIEVSNHCDVPVNIRILAHIPDGTNGNTGELVAERSSVLADGTEVISLSSDDSDCIIISASNDQSPGDSASTLDNLGQTRVKVLDILLYPKVDSEDDSSSDSDSSGSSTSSDGSKTKTASNNPCKKKMDEKSSSNISKSDDEPLEQHLKCNTTNARTEEKKDPNE